MDKSQRKLHIYGIGQRLNGGRLMATAERHLERRTPVLSPRESFEGFFLFFVFLGRNILYSKNTKKAGN